MHDRASSPWHFHSNVGILQMAFLGILLQLLGSGRLLQPSVAFHQQPSLALLRYSAAYVCQGAFQCCNTSGCLPNVVLNVAFADNSTHV